MEGACIYLNNNNIPTISMYKNYYSNKVLHLIYCNKIVYFSIITTKELTSILPNNCIHVLTKLPYKNNINDILLSWRIIILNKLLQINKA